MDTHHTPAEIIRQALLDDGFGTHPDDGDALPIYATSVPTEIDDVFGVLDTTGTTDPGTGRGTRVDHPGIQFIARNNNHVIGRRYARQAATLLDAMKRRAVTIDGYEYLITNVTRTTAVVPVGPQQQEDRRKLFSVNALVTVSQTGSMTTTTTPP